jgi:Putative heavy-metal chelation
MTAIERWIGASLDKSGLMDDRTIGEILTGRSFAAVSLNDGCVGAAMDYSHYRYGSESELVSSARGAETDELLMMSADARLAESGLLTAGADELNDTQRAVRVAVFNALSRPLLMPDALTLAGYNHLMASFEDIYSPDGDSLAYQVLARAVGEAETIGVIGFGGLMEPLARLASVKNVLVSDMNEAPRTAHIQQMLARFNDQFERPKIHFVGEDNERLRRDCQLVQITPSSLCNGTMDEVLALFCQQPLIVVGPSGTLMPDAWFGYGAVLVYMEPKDWRFINAYRYDDHLYSWFVEYDQRLLLWR